MAGRRLHLINKLIKVKQEMNMEILIDKMILQALLRVRLARYHQRMLKQLRKLQNQELEHILKEV